MEAALSGTTRTSSGKLVWVVLASALLAVIGAFAYRAYEAKRQLKIAVAQAEAAMARDTFGGFRDCDRALRDFVTPKSKRTDLISMRSYALAQLAARYGDDQAAVDSELLNATLERGDEGHRGELPGRYYAARALLLLANGEPGSALLMLSGSPTTADSPELQVVRAQVLQGLEKPADAQTAMIRARAHLPPSLEALLGAATNAHLAHQDARAAELAQKALAVNPNHWPSLLLVGDLALHSKAIPLPLARDLIERAMSTLTSEASPTEQCQALDELAQIDLSLQNIAGVFQTLDRGADIDETQPACRLQLARLNLRLGRERQALLLLGAAASDEDPGEASLVYAEASHDPKVLIEQASRPIPPELSAAVSARWQARIDALKLEATLSLDERKLAPPLAKRIEGWEIPQVQGVLARYRLLTGDAKGAAKLMDGAILSASKQPDAGDALAAVGERALELNQYPQAVTACAEGARRVTANYRAFLCEARALVKLRRFAEASAAVDQAVSLNPSAPEAGALRAQLAAPLTGP